MPIDKIVEQAEGAAKRGLIRRLKGIPERNLRGARKGNGRRKWKKAKKVVAVFKTQGGQSRGGGNQRGKKKESS